MGNAWHIIIFQSFYEVTIVKSEIKIKVKLQIKIRNTLSFKQFVIS